MMPSFDHLTRICRWGMLLGGVLLVWAASPAAQARAQAIDAELRRQIERDVRGSDLREKDGPLAKVGSQLARIYREHERHRYEKTGRPFRPRQYARSVDGDYVAIDAIADGDVRALRADLERLGLRQAATAGNLVSGYLPIEAIPEAAQLDALRMASVAVAALQAGLVTSQGDEAMHADSARATFDVDGSGITVGVLSDSYNTNPDARTSAEDDIATEDLPLEGVAVLQDLADGTDEGRAMLQIVHDVAPGAALAFHTAFGGQANFAQGIRNLASFGAEVIVDDVIYFTEPMFQDGVIAQAIDEVVDGGVAYFTAAGNEARRSYASPFRSSNQVGPGRGVLHDFDPTGATDVHQQITIPVDDSVRIAFQWADPYASTGGTGAESDLDIYLLDGSGAVVEQSTFNSFGADPVEFIAYRNAGDVDADGDGTPDETFDLVIERVRGPAPERIKYVYFPSSVEVEIDEYVTQSPTIFGHTNAEQAATVGAVFWFATPAFDDQFTNPFALNASSSVGGVPIYFRDDGAPLLAPEVRAKPDFTGPDGGNTTFFGQELNDGDNFPNFFGTSAAAPHVAGVAALMLQYDRERPPFQIYEDLAQTAVDVTQYLTIEDDEPVVEPIPDGEDFDFFSGYGLVQATAAVPNVAEVTAFNASPRLAEGRIALTWAETNEANNVVAYRIERRYFEGAFEHVATVQSLGPETHTYTSDELGLGIYTFRLTIIRNDGETEELPLRTTATIGLTAFDADVVDEEGTASDVELTWSVPLGTGDYRYIVQQRTDRGFVSIDTTTAQSYTVEHQPPGAYDFRLLMQDAEGNAFASDPVSVEIALEGAVAMGTAYPNPFVDRVQFAITLAAEEFVTVRVYNALGQLVQLFGQQIAANVPSTITLEADPAWASGVYFVQVEGEDFTVSRRAVLVR